MSGKTIARLVSLLCLICTASFILTPINKSGRRHQKVESFAARFIQNPSWWLQQLRYELSSCHEQNYTPHAALIQHCFLFLSQRNGCIMASEAYALTAVKQHCHRQQMSVSSGVQGHHQMSFIPGEALSALCCSSPHSLLVNGPFCLPSGNCWADVGVLGLRPGDRFGHWILFCFFTFRDFWVAFTSCWECVSLSNVKQSNRVCSISPDKRIDLYGSFVHPFHFIHSFISPKNLKLELCLVDSIQILTWPLCPWMLFIICIEISVIGPFVLFHFYIFTPLITCFYSISVDTRLQFSRQSHPWPQSRLWSTLFALKYKYNWPHVTIKPVVIQLWEPENRHLFFQFLLNPLKFHLKS